MKVGFLFNCKIYYSVIRLVYLDKGSHVTS